MLDTAATAARGTVLVVGPEPAEPVTGVTAVTARRAQTG